MGALIWGALQDSLMTRAELKLGIRGIRGACINDGRW